MFTSKIQLKHNVYYFQEKDKKVEICQNDKKKKTILQGKKNKNIAKLEE